MLSSSAPKPWQGNRAYRRAHHIPSDPVYRLLSQPSLPHLLLHYPDALSDADIMRECSPLATRLLMATVRYVQNVSQGGNGGGGPPDYGSYDFYVSPTGSDTNDGTSPSTAFFTIEAARNAARASGLIGTREVRVGIADGTYNLTAKVTFDTGDDGAPGAEMVYAALSGAIVVFDFGYHPISYGFEVFGCRYMRFEGLDFTKVGGVWSGNIAHLEAEKVATINRVGSHYVSDSNSGAALSVTAGVGLVFTTSGGSPSAGGSQNIRVRWCHAYKNDGNGFHVLTGHDIDFEDCYSYSNWGLPGGDADGFSVTGVFSDGGALQGWNINFYRCSAWSCFDNGIDVYASYNCYLEDCFCYDIAYDTPSYATVPVDQGFKLGSPNKGPGSGNWGGHKLVRCLAYRCGVGFSWNGANTNTYYSTYLPLLLENCTSASNLYQNWSLYSLTNTTKNCVDYDDSGNNAVFNLMGATQVTNKRDADGLSAADFVNTLLPPLPYAYSALSAAGFFQAAAGGKLDGAGTNLGADSKNTNDVGWLPTP